MKCSINRSVYIKYLHTLSNAYYINIRINAHTRVEFFFEYCMEREEKIIIISKRVNNLKIKIFIAHTIITSLNVVYTKKKSYDDQNIQKKK